MSKAQSKGQNMKGRNPSDSTTGSFQDEGNLDSNQSAQSMRAGEDDTTVNQSKSSDASTVADVEGSSPSFGEPKDLESAASNFIASSSEKISSEVDNLLSKASSVLDSQTVKKNLNLVKDKASEFISTGKEQISNKYSGLSDDVKLRGMMVNDNVKANPYAYALGAFGVGLIVGRALSGKGKSDLDFLVSTVNKLNLSSLAGALGLSLGGAEESQASSQGTGTYNKSQARKIG